MELYIQYCMYYGVQSAMNILEIDSVTCRQAFQAAAKGSRIVQESNDFPSESLYRVQQPSRQKTIARQTYERKSRQCETPNAVMPTTAILFGVKVGLHVFTSIATVLTNGSQAR
jgi:hypothetical protein